MLFHFYDRNAKEASNIKKREIKKPTATTKKGGIMAQVDDECGRSTQIHSQKEEEAVQYSATISDQQHGHQQHQQKGEKENQRSFTTSTAHTNCTSTTANTNSCAVPVDNNTIHNSMNTKDKDVFAQFEQWVRKCQTKNDRKKRKRQPWQQKRDNKCFATASSHQSRSEGIERSSSSSSLWSFDSDSSSDNSSTSAFPSDEEDLLSHNPSSFDKSIVVGTEFDSNVQVGGAAIHRNQTQGISLKSSITSTSRAKATAASTSFIRNRATSLATQAYTPRDDNNNNNERRATDDAIPDTLMPTNDGPLRSPTTSFYSKLLFRGGTDPSQRGNVHQEGGGINGVPLTHLVSVLESAEWGGGGSDSVVDLGGIRPTAAEDPSSNDNHSFPPAAAHVNPSSSSTYNSNVAALTPEKEREGEIKVSVSSPPNPLIMTAPSFMAGSYAAAPSASASSVAFSLKKYMSNNQNITTPSPPISSPSSLNLPIANVYKDARRRLLKVFPYAQRHQRTDKGEGGGGDKIGFDEFGAKRKLSPKGQPSRPLPPRPSTASGSLDVAELASIYHDYTRGLAQWDPTAIPYLPKKKCAEGENSSVPPRPSECKRVIDMILLASSALCRDEEALGEDNIITINRRRGNDERDDGNGTRIKSENKLSRRRRKKEETASLLERANSQLRQTALTEAYVDSHYWLNTEAQKLRCTPFHIDHSGLIAGPRELKMHATRRSINVAKRCFYATGSSKGCASQADTKHSQEEEANGAVVEFAEVVDGDEANNHGVKTSNHAREEEGEGEGKREGGRELSPPRWNTSLSNASEEDGGTIVLLDPFTAVDLTEPALVHVWESAAEAQRFQLSIQTITNALAHHMLSLGVFCSILTVLGRHASDGRLVSVVWLPPIASPYPVDQRPKEKEKEEEEVGECGVTSSLESANPPSSARHPHPCPLSALPAPDLPPKKSLSRAMIELVHAKIGGLPINLASLRAAYIEAYSKQQQKVIAKGEKEGYEASPAPEHQSLSLLLLPPLSSFKTSQLAPHRFSLLGIYAARDGRYYLIPSANGYFIRKRDVGGVGGGGVSAGEAMAHFDNQSSTAQQHSEGQEEISEDPNEERQRLKQRILHKHKAPLTNATLSKNSNHRQEREHSENTNNDEETQAATTATPQNANDDKFSSSATPPLVSQQSSLAQYAEEMPPTFAKEEGQQHHLMALKRLIAYVRDPTYAFAPFANHTVDGVADALHEVGVSIQNVYRIANNDELWQNVWEEVRSAVAQRGGPAEGSSPTQIRPSTAAASIANKESPSSLFSPTAQPQQQPRPYSASMELKLAKKLAETRKAVVNLARVQVAGRSLKVLKDALFDRRGAEAAEYISLVLSNAVVVDQHTATEATKINSSHNVNVNNNVPVMMRDFTSVCLLLDEVARARFGARPNEVEVKLSPRPRRGRMGNTGAPQGLGENIIHNAHHEQNPSEKESTDAAVLAVTSVGGAEAGYETTLLEPEVLRAALAMTKRREEASSVLLSNPYSTTSPRNSPRRQQPSTHEPKEEEEEGGELIREDQHKIQEGAVTNSSFTPSLSNTSFVPAMQQQQHHAVDTDKEEKHHKDVAVAVSSSYSFVSPRPLSNPPPPRRLCSSASIRGPSGLHDESEDVFIVHTDSFTAAVATASSTSSSPSASKPSKSLMNFGMGGIDTDDNDAIQQSATVSLLMPIATRGTFEQRIEAVRERIAAASREKEASGSLAGRYLLLLTVAASLIPLLRDLASRGGGGGASKGSSKTFASQQAAVHQIVKDVTAAAIRSETRVSSALLTFIYMSSVMPFSAVTRYIGGLSSVFHTSLLRLSQLFGKADALEGAGAGTAAASPRDILSASNAKSRANIDYAATDNTSRGTVPAEMEALRALEAADFTNIPPIDLPIIASYLSQLLAAVGCNGHELLRKRLAEVKVYESVAERALFKVLGEFVTHLLNDKSERGRGGGGGGESFIVPVEALDRAILSMRKEQLNTNNNNIEGEEVCQTSDKGKLAAENDDSHGDSSCLLLLSPHNISALHWLIGRAPQLTTHQRTDLCWALRGRGPLPIAYTSSNRDGIDVQIDLLKKSVIATAFSSFHRASLVEKAAVCVEEKEKRDSTATSSVSTAVASAANHDHSPTLPHPPSPFIINKAFLSLAMAHLVENNLPSSQFAGQGEGAGDNTRVILIRYSYGLLSQYLVARRRVLQRHETLCSLAQQEQKVLTNRSASAVVADVTNTHDRQVDEAFPSKCITVATATDDAVVSANVVSEEKTEGGSSPSRDMMITFYMYKRAVGKCARLDEWLSSTTVVVTSDSDEIPNIIRVGVGDESEEEKKGEEEEKETKTRTLQSNPPSSLTTTTPATRTSPRVDSAARRVTVFVLNSHTIKLRERLLLQFLSQKDDGNRKKTIFLPPRPIPRVAFEELQGALVFPLPHENNSNNDHVSLAREKLMLVPTTTTTAAVEAGDLILGFIERKWESFLQQNEKEDKRSKEISNTMIPENTNTFTEGQEAATVGRNSVGKQQHSSTTLPMLELYRSDNLRGNNNNNNNEREQNKKEEIGYYCPAVCMWLPTHTDMKFVKHSFAPEYIPPPSSPLLPPEEESTCFLEEPYEVVPQPTSSIIGTPRASVTDDDVDDKEVAEVEESDTEKEEKEEEEEENKHSPRTLVLRRRRIEDLVYDEMNPYLSRLPRRLARSPVARGHVIPPLQTRQRLEAAMGEKALMLVPLPHHKNDRKERKGESECYNYSPTRKASRSRQRINKLKSLESWDSTTSNLSPLFSVFPKDHFLTGPKQEHSRQHGREQAHDSIVSNNNNNNNNNNNDINPQPKGGSRPSRCSLHVLVAEEDTKGKAGVVNTKGNPTMSMASSSLPPLLLHVHVLALKTLPLTDDEGSAWRSTHRRGLLDHHHHDKPPVMRQCSILPPSPSNGKRSKGPQGPLPPLRVCHHTQLVAAEENNTQPGINNLCGPAQTNADLDTEENCVLYVDAAKTGISRNHGTDDTNTGVREDRLKARNNYLIFANSSSKPATTASKALTQWKKKKQ